MRSVFGERRGNGLTPEEAVERIGQLGTCLLHALDRGGAGRGEQYAEPRQAT